MVTFLVFFIVFGAVGMLIGQHKGRAVAGLLWAMLLGPIGWLLVALGPNLKQPKSRPCPHCSGVLPLNQKECNHCKNRVLWVNGKAHKQPGSNGASASRPMAQQTVPADVPASRGRG